MFAPDVSFLPLCDRADKLKGACLLSAALYRPTTFAKGIGIASSLSYRESKFDDSEHCNRHDEGWGL
jgi:hypothetical protein